MAATRPLPEVPCMETREEDYERSLIIGDHRNTEWPPIDQDPAFPATDLFRGGLIFQAQDMQACRFREGHSIIDAPHAWREFSGRNFYPHQRPYGLEIPNVELREHWTSTEQDTSCSGGGSWTSDSRSEAEGTYSSQVTPWNEDTRGLGISFAHGEQPYRNDYSVSPHDLQQCPDNYADENCVKPELHGKGTGPTYYPEKTGLCTPDRESIEYAPDDEPLDVPAQKRTSITSGMDDDDDDESMDDDAVHDDDDDYTPATAGHGHGRGVARGPLAVARKTGIASKRSQRSKAPAFPTQNSSKVTKKTAKTHVPSPSSTRNNTHCSHCPSLFPSDSTLKKHVLSTHTRPFVCTFKRYGCNATVGSKNEWKRHINVQHLHLEAWRCDFDACARPSCTANGISGPGKRKSSTPSSTVPPSLGKKANPSEAQQHDFDRKDLFTQHIKRMHAPSASASHADKAAFETRIPEIQERCHRQLRNPPLRSRCPYCRDKVFEGPGSWTDRLEHVGKHLEKNDVNEKEETEDEDLRNWMMQHGFMELDAHNGHKVQNTDGKKKRNKGVTMTSEGDEDAEGEEEDL